MTPDLSFNTAMSFITNTNWQNYAPEATVSYFSNMVALAMHNWMSAADGHRGCHRHRARLRPALGERARQLLGGHDPRHALRPAADLPGLRAVPGLAGRAAELRALHAGDDAGGREADHRAGAGGLAGSHQDAGHQRRRLLQRQLRASLREPDAAHQPAADALHLPDPGRADLHLRQDGGQHEAGLGALRGDDLHVRRSGSASATGPRRRATRTSRGSA